MAIDWDKHVLAPCMKVFGEDEPATYMPAAGGSFPVDLVFDAQYRDLRLLDDSSGFNTTEPVAGVRAAQFPNPPVQGDRIFVKRVNKTFVVRDPNPDSHGWIKLKLNRVSG